MNFEQNFKTEFVSFGSQCMAFVLFECSSNKQHCIGTYDTGLVELILVDNELFPQNGQIHQRAGDTDIT